MEIVHADQPAFAELWGAFTASNVVSWRHTRGVLQYQRAYSGDKLKQDASFVVKDNGGAVAICPMFVERFRGFPEVSWGNGWTPAPCFGQDLTEERQGKIRQLCFEEIERLSIEHEVRKARFVIDPSIQGGYNYLQRHGFIDTSLSSAVLDLSRTDDDLHAGLRKSYKSIINKARRNFTFVIVDHGNPSRELVECYREMHHKAAGRVTRPQESFDAQHECITMDQGALIGIRNEDGFVAFSYFFHGSLSCYYGSSADDPAYQGDLPLEHAIIWAAVEYYKKRGLRFFELGPQHFGPQVYEAPSSKEMSIAFFKRGFGAELRPLFRGVKYYSGDLLQEELSVGVGRLRQMADN